MPQLSGFPAGLLSLVGSQNFGENVRELAYVVGPIVDLTDMYACTQQVLLAGTNAAATGGFNSCANGIGPVPQGELWRVVAIGGSVVTGAGVTIGGWSPSVRKDGADVVLMPQVAAAASQTIHTGGALTAPLLLTPGCDVGIKATQVAGGTFIAAVQLLFARLRM